MNQALGDALFWGSVACIVVAQVAIARSTLFARPGAQNPGVPRPRRPVEVLWVILPTVALVLALFFTWRALHPAAAATAPAAAHDLDRPAPTTAADGGHQTS